MTTAQERQQPVDKYVVALSRRFVFSTIVLAAFGAFVIGIGTGHRVNTTRGNQERDQHSLIVSGSQIHSKIAPDTVYSSKIFDSEMAALVSLESTLLHQHVSAESEVVRDEDNDDEDHQDQTNQVHHESSGYHLAMEIGGVDAALLGSKKRLQRAMMQLAENAHFALLSHHCWLSSRARYRCIGISLHSHINLETWPEASVLVVDVFSQDEQCIESMLPIIERDFVDRKPTKQQVRWTMRKRGFPCGTRINPEVVDIEQFLLGRTDVKEKNTVASLYSDYQQVEIYDVVDPRRRPWLGSQTGSPSQALSYQLEHPELFRPDRVLYLDSILQSRRFGEAAYHEALVHPAMFAHPNPKRVAIIGGGEGATLREVLKHNTVEAVTMIEIDSKVVEISQKYLPEWVDCSDFVGRTSCCLNDTRADLVYEDAIAWFIDRYGGLDEQKSDSYDVIIMDALDPESVVEFSDILYKNTDFLQAISNALSGFGILVAQMGEQNNLNDPPASASDIDRTNDFVRGLKETGFQHISSYYEEHGGFLGVWDFLIAFKEKQVKKYWYSNEAEVQLRVRERTVETVSGETSLRFFDGATMVGYQHPSKVEQEINCRNKPPPTMCNPDVVDLEKSLPKDYLGGAISSINDLVFMPSTHALIENLTAHSFVREWQPLNEYRTTQGSVINFFGAAAVVVDSACPISGGATKTERKVLTEPNPTDNYVFNPFIERNYIRYLKTSDCKEKDLK